jgi:hypothetical protein
VIGLGLGLGLAAIYETTLAAAIGVACGLLVIGLGAVEMSRRYVLEVPLLSVLVVLGRPWIAVAAAGAAAFGLVTVVTASPAAILFAVAAAACAAAAIVAYRGPWRSRVTT